MTAFVGAQLDRSYTTNQLTGSGSYNVPGLGDIYVSHDNKKYRFVQYNSGAGAIAAVIGNAVGYYAPGGVSTGTTMVVTSDVSETAGIFAGVLMSTPNSGDWAWIQTDGPAVITTALVSGATGNPLRLSASTDGTLQVVAAVTDVVAGVLVQLTSKTVVLRAPV